MFCKGVLLSLFQREFCYTGASSCKAISRRSRGHGVPRSPQESPYTIGRGRFDSEVQNGVVRCESVCHVHNSIRTKIDVSPGKFKVTDSFLQKVDLTAPPFQSQDHSPAAQ